MSQRSTALAQPISPTTAKSLMTRYVFFARMAALTVVLLGTAAFAGWATDTTVLKSVSPNLMPMKPNTAVGLILNGIALLLLVGHPSSRLRRCVAFACAAIPMLIGAVALCEYFWTVDLVINRLLFPASLKPSAYGRMSVPTALSFIALGLGYSLWAWRKNDVALQLAALVVGLLALTGLVAYGYATKFYAQGPAWTYALHTAVASLLLSLGTLAALANRGLTAVLSDPTSGGALARRLLLMAVVAPTLLGWLALFGERQGLYTTGVGTSINVAFNVLAIACLVVSITSSLARAELYRGIAESRLLSVAQIPAENPQPVLRIGHAGEVLYANHAAEAMLNGKQILQAEPLAAKIRDAALSALETGKCCDFELTFRDGRVLAFACVVVADKGYLNNLYGRDVTKERNVQAALRESEQRFRQLADSMPQLVWAASPDGHIDYFNARWREAMGNGHVPDGGDTDWLPLLHPDDRQNTLDQWHQAVRKGILYQTEHRLRLSPQADYRWFLCRAVPIRNQDGQILRWYGTSTDVQDMKLTQERARLQAAALNAAANGIAITDADGTILWVNQAFCQLTGYASEEVIGKTHRVLKSGRQNAEFYHNLWSDIRLGQTWHGELVNRRKDGSEYAEDMTIALLRDASGAITNFIAVKQDISRRRSEQEALAAAKLAAEDASHAKDQFLAVLSHELRTPLTPVMAALAMLQAQGGLDSVAHHHLELIQRNVELETRLIDDLLDINRITRGKIELCRQPICLRELIQRSVEVVQPDIQARDLHLSVDTQAACCTINADATRLQQVFWNLLRNAVKFTPPGGSIAVQCRQTTPDQVTVDVRDTGEGIDPNALPRIFDAFEQPERAATRRFGGLGLGLAISKALVEMHGGTIQAHSAGKGKGATLSVRLPIVLHTPKTPPPPSPTLPVTRPLRIFLVEDHPDTARVMRQLLTLEGHRVELAGDVATAIKTFNAERFDLIISDLGLPDGSGADILRQLRAHGCTTPAIAASGYGMEEDIRQSKEAGFAAHLTKPMRPDRLAEAIAAATRSELCHSATAPSKHQSP